MSLEDRYPSVAYLAARAKRRIPHFIFEYVDSGTGAEAGLARSVDALQRVQMWPGVMAGRFEPEMSVDLWGTRYAAPFGVAPMGMVGLMWPGSEQALAKAAAKAGVPMCLSTMANSNPESVGRHVGDMGWFQLYPPRDPEIREDLLARAKANNWKVLVVTVDVPVGSSRERQRRAGVRLGLPKHPFQVLDVALRWSWLYAVWQHGRPRFWTVEPYTGGPDLKAFGAYLAEQVDMTPSWDYMAELRDLWDGPMVVKGILRPEDAERCVSIGFDGIGVSSHGARQLDAVPAAIDALPAVKAAVGDKAKIIFDSGLRGGLDIARALALGADMCLLGRAFAYGAGALGTKGPAHVIKMLQDDLRNVMVQMAAERLSDLPNRLVDRTGWPRNAPLPA
ncbi:MAG: alpha-hydroxy acid oxidase [Pseudomonadota bacterium]